MKKMLYLFLLLPFISFAQQPSQTCDLDIHGCYMYAMKALAHGNHGLNLINNSKKNKTLYFPKAYYTVGFPETIDGYEIRFVDLELSKETLLKEQQAKKGLVTYMSDLSLGADTCSLWLIPITFRQKGNEIINEYSETGCHVYFYFNKDLGKMCYAKTECPPAKKD